MNKAPPARTSRAARQPAAVRRRISEIRATGPAAPAVAIPPAVAPATAPDFLSLFGDASILRWVVHLRWAMIIVLLALGMLLAGTGAISWEMYAATALLSIPVAAYNLAFVVLLHLAPLWDDAHLLRRLRWWQVPPDVLVLTLGIHLTGGATTSLAMLYVFLIIIAIVLTPRYGTYVVATEITLCYSLLVLIETTILPPPTNRLTVAADIHAADAALVYAWHLVNILGVIWVVAYVADRLAQRIQASEDLISRQLNDLTLLYRFSDSLSAAPNLDAAMQYIVNELAGILDADSGSLMLINERGTAEFRAAVGISQEALLAYRQHPVDRDNPLLRMLLNGEAGIFAPDVDAVAGLRAALIRGGTRSFYSFPLRAEARMVGLLNISFDRPYTMAPSIYDLVASCSRQAGLAIERTILYHDAQRAAREMSSLYHIGLATASSLEINSVLRQVADQVQGVLMPDSFVLAFYDSERELLDFVLMLDRDVELPRAVLPLDSAGASGWIVKTRQPLLIHHWDQEIADLPFTPATSGANTQSVLGVPLVVNDHVLGVMSVQKLEPDTYDEAHVRLLAAIAGQAAMALENARLHEAVRQQALRDSLTNAYNHAALIDSIDRAVDYARASAETVSLIMLDIDLFKQYNDTYGHVAGDDALRTVVRAINQSVKTTDSVGRWGGEEFAVVLPAATTANALAVARRIRAALAAIEMPSHDGIRLPVPTISQGIACYPVDSTSSAQLIDHADTALYQAKAQGRDCFVTWGDVSAAAVPSPAAPAPPTGPDLH